MALDLERRFAACVWFLIVAVVLLLLAGCDDRPPCLHSHKETQVHYPNMGLIALGGAWISIAMIPQFRTVEVCDVYGEPDEGITLGTTTTTDDACYLSNDPNSEACRDLR
jgi:hypothetical protein